MKKEHLTILRKEKQSLQSVLERAQSRLKNAPEGTLVVNMTGSFPSYYQNELIVGSKKSLRKYLGKKDAALIRALAQKSYDRMVVRAAETQIKVIDEFLEGYEPDALKNIFKSFHPFKKGLVESEEPDDEEYVRLWESFRYAPGEFEEGAPEIYTLKGERVRSKSEKIIADTLFVKGIPYRYAPKLVLKDGSYKRPDFLVLNIRTREEYILEHLGMMDDPDYSNRNTEKIRTYIMNDIYPGEKLVLTMETGKKPLSTEELDKIINHYFL